MLPPGQLTAVRVCEPRGMLAGKYKAELWCDVIHSEGVRVLATFGADYYAGMPALTENLVGKGRVIPVGTASGGWRRSKGSRRCSTRRNCWWMRTWAGPCGRWVSGSLDSLSHRKCKCSAPRTAEIWSFSRPRASWYTCSRPARFAGPCGKCWQASRAVCSIDAASEAVTCAVDPPGVSRLPGVDCKISRHVPGLPGLLPLVPIEPVWD